MKYCDQCGAKLRDVAKFCSECGNKLEEATIEKEVINHNDIVKRIINEINLKENEICCWEICENVILYNLRWSDTFAVTDLRNPDVVAAMENHEKDYKEIMNHWLFYMKGMEDYQVLIHRPIWVSAAVDKNFFYINDGLEFIKCSFKFDKDGMIDGEKWENVQYLYGPHKELRILARENGYHLTSEYYLFDGAGNILWKADAPVKYDTCNRKIGYEFTNSESGFHNSQMVVDFYTGNILLKDVYGVLFYKEKETNLIVIDSVSKQEGRYEYKHELYNYQTNKVGSLKETFNNNDFLLPYEKYDIYDDCDFKEYQMYPNPEELKKVIKQESL